MVNRSENANLFHLSNLLILNAKIKDFSATTYTIILFFQKVKKMLKF